MIFIAFAAITDTFRCHKMWAISRYSSFYYPCERVAVF
jgi:hypothetical protein